MEIRESALQLPERAIDRVSDSDGHLSNLRDRLEEIHHNACQVVRPDPVEPARRLFTMEPGSDLDVFSGAVVKYAEILGAEG
jgi:hypothetical protein